MSTYNLLNKPEKESYNTVHLSSIIRLKLNQSAKIVPSTLITLTFLCQLLLFFIPCFTIVKWKGKELIHNRSFCSVHCDARVQHQTTENFLRIYACVYVKCTYLRNLHIWTAAYNVQR